jgi:hypothetical protein
MSFVSAASYGLVALTEFANSTWFVTTPTGTYSLFSSHFLWWGIIDAAIAVAAVVGGVSILRGGILGMVLGFAGATFSGIRWFFYIPSSPWLSVTIIALDILVVYALASNADYFEVGGGAGP